ncbi:MAG: protein nirF [Rhodospirillales bacterium]|nr:protein nirF [Rhodospirillales bacterium]
MKRLAALVLFLFLSACAGLEPRGTGDLGIIIERATGSVLVVDTTKRAILGRIEGLGDLSHASMVFSRDQRYAYIFGRDGGLSKVDLLERRIAARIVQAGNSIGGAIGPKGDWVAAANYEPGGVKFFDAASLAQLAEIPALVDGKASKVIGIAEAPGNRLVFSLYDAGEIWLADMTDVKTPWVRKFKQAGQLPYDGLITYDGRHYLAGLFGEDGLALLDLWNLEAGTKKIMPGYGKGQEPLPVYKMPHLRGWSQAGDEMFLPAIGRHEVLVVDRRGWKEAARIPVAGQPVFVIARPDGRQVWVNFALPNNGLIQVIDVPTRQIVKTLKPGKAILHLEFASKGTEVWVSARDDDQVIALDTETFAELARIPAQKPSGIFFTSRAHRLGL